MDALRLHCGGFLTGLACVDLTMAVSCTESCFISDYKLHLLESFAPH